MTTALLLWCLASASTAEPGVPLVSHQWSIYFRSGASLYLSQSRTAGGVGGGLGVRNTMGERFLLQGDVQYLTLAGNVVELRVGGGIQRRGMWAPAGLLVLSGLLGDRLAFLNDDHPQPVRLPPLSLGLHLIPLRFIAGRTTVALLDLGVGLGAELPGLGVSYRLGLVEVGASF